MITIKSAADIARMREAGRISKDALLAGGRIVRPGVSTAEIDAEIERFIRSQRAIPSFKGYNGFPASACISINDEVIHGIPGHRKVQEGDIVSIDVGAYIGGFHGDNAATYAVGSISPEAERLIAITRDSFFEGIKFAKVGFRIGDISHAIQKFAESHGFSVVRPYVGHGIGASLHEDPEVPNHGSPGRGPRLTAGMTLAIEPMINMGEKEIRVLPDGWTVITLDGKPSAHYENTILITEGEPEILTLGTSGVINLEVL